MKNLNSVSLIGRLTKDVEIKATNEMFIISGDLCFNTTRRNGNSYEDEANFVRLVIYSKKSPKVDLLKGQQLAISGSLKIEKYEDKNGNSKVLPKILVNDYFLIGDVKKHEPTCEELTQADAKKAEISQNSLIDSDEETPW